MTWLFSNIITLYVLEMLVFIMLCSSHNSFACHLGLLIIRKKTITTNMRVYLTGSGKQQLVSIRHEFSFVTDSSTTPVRYLRSETEVQPLLFLLCHGLPLSVLLFSSVYLLLLALSSLSLLLSYSHTLFVKLLCNKRNNPNPWHKHAAGIVANASFGVSKQRRSLELLLHCVSFLSNKASDSTVGT